MNKLFMIISMLVLSEIAFAYKSGAPKDACKSMIPEHGVDPQTGPMPYTISVNQTDHLKPGNVIIIKIVGKGEEKFKGFFVQARDNDKIMNGTFSKVFNTNVIDCSPGIKNAVTHSSPNDKKSISIPWVVPNHKGTVQIYATIVKNGGTFWVQQKSQKITIH